MPVKLISLLIRNEQVGGSNPLPGSIPSFRRLHCAYIAAARAAANSEHFTSVAPSICRAKS